MENRETIILELKNISRTVAGIAPANVLTVPDHYFDNLATQIIEKIQRPIFNATSKQPAPFIVPPGFFDSLAGNILDKINNQQQKGEVETELAGIAPLLNTISKSPVYAVPDYYFEQLSIQPGTALQSKIIKMPVRKYIVRMAAAAVITAFMAVGGYVLFDDSKLSNINPAINVAAAVENLSDAEIQEYLEKYAGSEMSSSAFLPLQDTDIDNYIDDMSEAEIQEYLKENSEPGEKINQEI